MRTRQLGLELAARSGAGTGSRAQRKAQASAVAAMKRALREPRAAGHGGKRKGAGRKPKGARAGMPHCARQFLSARHPVHVVLRVTPEVGRLRRRRAYHAFRWALVSLLRRTDFRVVHISIQADHVHLICEASDRLALSRGIRGLCISAAKHLNSAIGEDCGMPPRRGRVFTDRYHATVITNPRQSRSALAYVLNNWRHHDEDRASAAANHARIDPYSSAIAFPGWADGPAAWMWPPAYQALTVSRPRTWLLTTAWQRHTPIRLDERP